MVSLVVIVPVGLIVGLFILLNARLVWTYCCRVQILDLDLYSLLLFSGSVVRGGLTSCCRLRGLRLIGIGRSS